MAFNILLKNTGKNIASLRKKQELNQKETASLCDISYRYYQNIEAGEANMKLSTLFRLAQIFGVHVAELLNGSSKR